MDFSIVTTPGDEVLWDAWTDTPSWCTGFTVLRFVNDVYGGFRDVAAATMYAGWMDNGSGWSSSATLPFTFASPPNVAKVLWNRVDSESAPQTLMTSPWPGGNAFDFGMTGTRLVRSVSEDLRRLQDGTLAFWFGPQSEEGVVAAISGALQTTFSIRYAGSGTEFEFGEGQVMTAGHQSGD